MQTEMLILYVTFLALLFQQGLPTCLISVNNTDEAGNVIEVFNTCEMGDCVGNKCVCHDGWTGNLCDHCSGRIILDSATGYIFDGPKNYSHLSKCSWLIQPSTPHSSLRLSFHEFATECGWDHLYIYDGDSAFSPLIGSFNGLLYAPGLTSRPMPEVVARSGTAYLYFYSDAAYTMLGFNISYTVDQCQNNCSDSGACVVGECQCDGIKEGQLCNLCPNNCSTTPNDLVDCSSESAMDCNSTNQEGVWSVTELDASVVPARASSALSLYDNRVWMYGGLEFGVQSHTSSVVSVFNTSLNTWEVYDPSVRQNVTPEARYEHTMVTWNDTLIVFGGTLVRDETAVNEMWEYDLLRSRWEPVMYSADFGSSVTNARADMTRLTLSGHTADVVRFENGTEIMVVLFGYHPAMTFTRFVYEYNPSTKLWRMPRPSGVSMPGLLGHSTVYDAAANLIYIHGGHKLGQVGQTLSSNTYMYNPVDRTFSTLRSSGVPRYLHSASLVNGVMYVYGGNTDNTSAENGGSLCYSSNFMAYNVACDSWVTLSSPSNSLYPHRYGHQSVAVSFDDSGTAGIYVFSGYDSTMIANMLFYRPPSCSDFEQSTCTDAMNAGISCSWNGTHCMPSLSPNCLVSDNSHFCTTPSFNTSCADCVSNAYNCSYCSSSCGPAKGSCGNNTCGDLSDSYCKSLINCEQCDTAGADCLWTGRSCVPRPPDVDANSRSNCAAPCSSATSCRVCDTLSSCMWCQNPAKCIPSSSYEPLFPYGQCLEWSNDNKCPAFECSSHETCSECQKYAKCGWCDDGSMTGLGRCVEGSHAGAVVLNQTTEQYEVKNQVCAGDSWFFVSCPKCQCNGHSKCEFEDQCIDCEDNTIGPQCNACEDGYFGSPLNGGNCSACQCNEKADTCQSTGDCNCFTKGVIGFSCDKCDEQSNYIGNATGNGTCFYPLLVNYIYTFNLSPSADKYITAINFQNTPPERENVQLKVTSLVPTNVRIAVAAGSNTSEVTLGEFFFVTSVKFNLDGGDLNFGDASMNSTIRVYVSNFTAPNTIQVSLLQRSNTLLTILLILFSVFLVLVILAAIGWKLKLIYDAHRRRANRAIQMKEMAARPFASVHLCCDDSYRSTQSLLTPGTQGYELLTEDQVPDPFCEEKCGDENASVLSVFLWMPSSAPNSAPSQDSGSSHSSDSLDCYVTPPPGQTALAIGTILTSSTPSPSQKRAHVSRNSRTDELPSAVASEQTVVRAYDNHAMQHLQV